MLGVRSYVRTSLLRAQRQVQSFGAQFSSPGLVDLRQAATILFSSLVIFHKNKKVDHTCLHCRMIPREPEAKGRESKE